MKYDVIVIGGGLGGLTAGARLAKEGKSVLLIEQHDRPGGCATTFKRKEYIMEVGLHEMDGLHEGDPKNKVFEELGIFEDVEFLPLPDFFRLYHDKTDFVMPHDEKEAIARLQEHFPHEKEGIETYFNRLMNAKRINVMERKQPDISIGEYLDSIINDDELKLVLLGNLGYFHDDPYSLALRYYSMAESAYFHGRANFIKKGSQELSNKLMNIIRQNGGKVLLSHKVTNILHAGNRIEGVEFINTLPGDHAFVTAKADDYIANAALPSIAEMIGGECGMKLTEKITEHPVGASLLTVYFGFSKSLKELGHQYYSTFVYDESVKSPKDIYANNRGDFSKRSFTFVDYSQVDSCLAPEGKSVGAVCTVDYLCDWENLSREEYKKKKKEVAEIFRKRVNELVPGCDQYIEHIEVGTSKTVQRYTLNPKGAVYGFAQLPNRTPIDSVEGAENLFIASAWGKFGGGFSGALFSGYMTAINMLRRR